MEPVAGLEYLLPAALGIGLAAASGFRVFAPLLIMALSARTGYMPIGDSFSWLATTPALIMLGLAAIIEVVAYYVPGLDNILDAIASPAAVIAGVTVAAAVMTDMPPMIKWSLAIIAGGGAAGLTQGATTLLRGHSTALTGGLGNPAIATGELLGAVGMSFLAIAAPTVALAIAVLFCLAAYYLARKLIRRRAPRNGA